MNVRRQWSEVLPFGSNPREYVILLRTNNENGDDDGCSDYSVFEYTTAGYTNVNGFTRLCTEVPFPEERKRR